MFCCAVNCTNTPLRLAMGRPRLVWRWSSAKQQAARANSVNQMKRSYLMSPLKRHFKQEVPPWTSAENAAVLSPRRSWRSREPWWIISEPSWSLLGHQKKPYLTAAGLKAPINWTISAIITLYDLHLLKLGYNKNKQKWDNFNRIRPQ